jgi:radical SAM superfamily enzyme YgiQ (UPF0313 family)
MVDVILIRPISASSDEESYMRYLTIPHGPLTLAAHLVAESVSVRIIDEVAESDPQGTLLESLKNRPACVGISSMTGRQIENGLRFAAIVRSYDKNIPIVWGGAHPTLLPLLTLQDPFVDIVVYGEGDISFPLLVERLKNRENYADVAGICFKTKDSELVTNPPSPRYDMNDTPAIPYDLIDMEKYITGIKKRDITRYFEVVTSKGCPYRCAFCSNSINPSAYAKKDTEKIIDEIRVLVDKYHIDGLGFSDENFILNRERMNDLCSELLRADFKLHIRAGGRIDLFSRLDDATLGLMKKAGFYHFGFGVESGSEKTLGMINKNITLEQVYDVVGKIKSNGFQATYNFMGGFPGEEIREYKRTLELMYYIFENSKAVIYPINGPKCFTPFPGAALFYEATKRGYCEPRTFREWSGIDYNNEKLPWIDEECRDLIVRSKGIVNEINRKFSGESARVCSEDLDNLRQIMR